MIQARRMRCRYGPGIFRWRRGRGEEEEADPEKLRVPDLSLALKIMLQKSSRLYNCNIKLLVTAFMYIQMYLHIP
jgi:hypothetical protein